LARMLDMRALTVSNAQLVDAEIMAQRLAAVPKRHQPAADRALAWLAAIPPPRPP